jgi:hypothetical protein
VKKKGKREKGGKTGRPESTGRLMGPKQREALSAEAIGANLFSELLLAYAELRLLEKHEEAVDVGLKLLPYIKPKLRSHEHKVQEEVVIRFTVGGEGS